MAGKPDTAEIVEVEPLADSTARQARRVVAPGEIDPEHVVTPGIFVDRVVEVANPEEESDLIAANRSYP